VLVVVVVVVVVGFVCFVSPLYLVFVCFVLIFGKTTSKQNVKNEKKRMGTGKDRMKKMRVIYL